MAFKDQVNVGFANVQETINSDVIDVSRYSKGAAQLEAVMSGTPTLPTLDVTLEYSLDGTNFFAWATPVAFTQLTDSSSAAEHKLFTTLPGKFLRVVATVGGSDYADAVVADPEAEPPVEAAVAIEWTSINVKLNLER